MAISGFLLGLKKVISFLLSLRKSKRGLREDAQKSNVFNSRNTKKGDRGGGVVKTP